MLTGLGSHLKVRLIHWMRTRYAPVLRTAWSTMQRSRRLLRHATSQPLLPATQTGGSGRLSGLATRHGNACGSVDDQQEESTAVGKTPTLGPAASRGQAGELTVCLYPMPCLRLQQRFTCDIPKCPAEATAER